ncbi:Rha family transcriptional regulator [Sporosarcina sp. resist]|uniref:Rha family transcriptional regulator n=1 Tax=Sporosarcina sp. resist TaxID=2762563 RepID=UPI00164E887B|nr:Rha family transcriptional regulator [Sporosarcina sp. resist]QNK89064.1 Rha family transcriptional regulator [Sporosarcina sp. resist]
MTLQQIIEGSGIVYVAGSKAFTDSLLIAEVFEKGHDKVLRDIRNLKCSEEFLLANFGESSYTNKQKRVMPMFILTFDGFVMLAMGYTGEKAMQFKELYIAEFNRTRQILENQKNTLISMEQKLVRLAVREVIHSRYPNLTDGARRKYFTRLHKELKERFNVCSYKDVPRSEYQDVLTFIHGWESPLLVSGIYH